MKDEEIHKERKFRARRVSTSILCDECGIRIPLGEWSFKRNDEWHYGGESPFNGRIRIVDESTKLCQDCVNREEVVSRDRGVIKE